MSIDQKIHLLAGLLKHEVEDLQLWLAEHPHLSSIAKLQIVSMAIRYQLDPLCDEISFMETTSGSLPFITIDGWVKLINSHEQFAGLSLREATDLREGLPPWIECTIYRNDRILPIVVREYLDEVKTEHSSWVQMPRRMLRHRAIQQCARLAFGISNPEIPSIRDRQQYNYDVQPNLKQTSSSNKDKLKLALMNKN